MSRKFDNKVVFAIYSWVSLVLFILMLVIGILVSISVIGGYKSMIPDRTSFILIPLLFALFIRIFDAVVKPAYFEAEISFDRISIKTFNPNPKNGSRFFLMPLFKNYLKVYTIERQSYNNYRVSIERFGIRKSLVLQKIENGKLYESQPINISFLGARKYTDLILAIDRLREKISLN